MRRISLLYALPALLMLALPGCDTVTDLDTVSVEGEWRSAGAIQALTHGMTLRLNPETNGTFTGTWRQQGGQELPVVDGVNQNGSVRFTVVGFQGGSREFVGQFTDAFRLEGSMSGVQLEGAAVFRRASF